MIRAALLRPLANRDEDRLFYLRQSAPGTNVVNATFSVPEIQDLNKGLKTITELGTFSFIDFTIVGLGTPHEIPAGVVEARSHTGELFGFARSEKLSRNSAEQILEAARAFGQEDDITVVTLAPLVRLASRPKADVPIEPFRFIVPRCDNLGVVAKAILRRSCFPPRQPEQHGLHSSIQQRGEPT